MARAFPVLMVVAAGLIAGLREGCDAQEPQILRSVQEIHDLPQARRRDRVPVEMECIVSYYNSDWPNGFFNDGVNGIYGEITPDLDIRPGDRIRLSGVVGPHGYIVDYSATPSDNGVELPDPIDVSFDSLQNGHVDSQYVRIAGQLVSVDVETHHVILELAVAPDRKFRTLIHESQATVDDMKALLGRSISVVGTAGAHVDRDGHVMGFQVWVSDPVNISAGPPDSNAEAVIPLSTVADVVRSGRMHSGIGFFRVNGRVIHHLSDSLILVYDGTGTLFVELLNVDTLPEVGTTVEVRGIRSHSIEHPMLRRADLKNTLAVVPETPEVLPADLTDLVDGKYNGQIVATSGEFGGAFVLNGRHGFYLRDGSNFVPVFLQKDGSEALDAQTGTSVQVSGVWVYQSSLHGFGVGANAIYAKSSDVKFGNQIPWGPVAVGAVAALCFLWAVTLQHKVRQQTERIRDEFEKRQQLEQRYADIFTNAQVMVMTTDMNGRITAINPAVSRVTGLSESMLIGSSVLELVDADSRDQLRRSLEASDVDDCGATDLNIRTSGEELIPQQVSWWISEMHGELQVHSIWHDLSDRLQLERQRSDFEQRILHTQKMESLGVLAGGIAHDFNNLLTVVMGNVSILRLSSQLSPDDRKSAQRIEEAAQRASELTQQMLAYSGRGRFHVVPVSVTDLIMETEQLLHASISKSTNLVLDTAMDLPAVNADATQLRQVIMNLTINASESLDGSVGTVTVAVDATDCEPADFVDCIVSEIRTAGRFIRIRVSDDGSGMDESTLERIFDPFYSTKFAGRGLGLSAVLGIIKGHQGAIRVSSTAGAGSVFEILLPVVPSPSVIVEPPPQPENAPTATGRVLVVDDEDAVRELLTTALEIAGMEVSSAGNAGDAVGIFREHSSDLDCAIVDLTMPDMQGDQLALKLRDIRGDIPIILCSGYNESEIGELQGAIVISEFLHKPFRVSDVVNCVNRVIAQCNTTNQA